MVAAELRAKLELPDGFRFDWTGLAASDTQGRARAFASLAGDDPTAGPRRSSPTDGLRRLMTAGRWTLWDGRPFLPHRVLVVGLASGTNCLPEVIHVGRPIP